jgi:hypothetical protein
MFPVEVESVVEGWAAAWSVGGGVGCWLRLVSY